MSKITPYDHVVGEWVDLIVKRPYHDGYSVVMLGERNIGTVIRPPDRPTPWDGWAAITSVHPYPRHLRMVRGFRTRAAAVDHLLTIANPPPEDSY